MTFLFQHSLHLLLRPFRRTATATLLIAVLAGCAVAPTIQPIPPTAPKQRIDRAADLPRFTYPVSGDLADLLRDNTRFNPLAQTMRQDAAGLLARYDIGEKASQRQYLGLLAQIALLDGRYDDVLQLAAQIKDLQEKPADKLLSGLQLRAMVGAAKTKGGRESAAYRAEVGRLMAAELAALPYAVVQNDIMRSKASAEFLGEALTLGRVREVLQPIANKTGTLSSDLAPALVGARYTLDFVLPLKTTLVETYGDYLKANRVDKADIWAARDVSLAANRPYKPVAIAVWDSGVDPQLFSSQRVMDNGQAAFIAFDKYYLPSSTPLMPITNAVQANMPVMQARSKGLSDSQSNIDSPEAAEVKAYLSGLKTDEYKAAQETLRLTGNYQHGTHVAGIAMAGNPYARLVNARIEFGYTLLPDPCPTRELQAQGAANFGAYVDFIRKQGVRVVNMSWGGNVRSYESSLEQCGMGTDAAGRKALAREYFQMHWEALKRAMASAPGVIFVASAGNSGNDPSFNEAYPASIVLPNLITVGAVDKAGDEAAFTSYGPTVAVHANGYQVDSDVPGGKRVALSGTSMSAPQVTNLAAKILVVNPALSAGEVIAIIKRTAEKTADRRRTLIHPANAMAAAGYRP